MVAAGTARGLADYDYRITVHDLRTGALVAGWSPGIEPFRTLPTPFVGVSEDGHVLLPITDGLAEIEAVVP